MTAPPVPVRPSSPRPVTLPAVGSVAVGGWLVDQLPGCFAGDDFLRRFVALFQDLADGLRQRIDGIEHAVDLSVAPPVFVRWMGGWLGVTGIDPSLSAPRQRDLVLGFGGLLVQRGTRAGLKQALELVTGEPVVVRDPGAIVREGDSPRPAAPVRIELAGPGAVGVDDVLAVMEDWLPVAASAELWIGGRRVGAVDERGRR
ncbi:MAG TPA: phage tail protein [Acidimicrobiia bacterium]|nr:phage tail protein [Acidimicrobiia bacterium]